MLIMSFYYRLDLLDPLIIFHFASVVGMSVSLSLGLVDSFEHPLTNSSNDLLDDLVHFLA